MTPIGLLMLEHRLIERMVKLLDAELRRMRDTARADPGFLLAGVDFFHTYANRTHHGKEEDIFFDKLDDKPLAHDDRQMMGRLIEEHIWMRETVGRLAAANDRYVQGNPDALMAIMHDLEKLVVFYPLHIRKEDKQFFLPALNYLAEDEQQALVESFQEFDARMIHEKYRRVVEENERRAVGGAVH